MAIVMAAAINNTPTTAIIMIKYKGNVNVDEEELESLTAAV